MIRFLQANLNHSRVAQDYLSHFMGRERVDVAILSDPHRDENKTGWFSTNTGPQGAAIWVLGEGISASLISRNSGFVAANVNGVHVFSCYAAPGRTRTIAEFTAFIQRLESAVRTSLADNAPVLIAGDFNARSAAWSDWETNSRGNILSSMLDTLGLLIINEGSNPTFVGIGRGSIVDIAAVSENIVNRINGWSLLTREENMSDHEYIVYEVQDTSRPVHQTGSERCRGWDTTGGIDLDMFETGLLIAQWTGSANNLTSCQDMDSRAVMTENYISAACNFSLRTKRPHLPGKPPAYWWNVEIAGLHKECVRQKRIKTRKIKSFYVRQERAAASGHYFNADREVSELTDALSQFQMARRSLKKAIAQSKTRCWKNLIESVDKDPWGKPYQLIMKKFHGAPAISLMTEEQVSEVIGTLFPQDNHLDVPLEASICPQLVPLFTRDEVNATIRHMVSRNSAPGLDGISSRILEAANLVRPDMLVDLFNGCITSGNFPRPWKKARVVLLKKPNKPDDEPSSFRPICLLNDTGKLLEGLLAARTEEWICGRGGLSPCQFGFRKRLSTDDAVRQLVTRVNTLINSGNYCVAVSLDIKNAFNSLRWRNIMKSLNDWQLPQYLVRIFRSYFSYRSAVIDVPTSTRGSMEIAITRGVPQGSVVGPLLWNITYDQVLRLRLPEGVEITGFADDTLLLVAGKTIEDIQNRTNEALAITSNKIKEIGLELSVHKTEAVLFTSKNKYVMPRVMIDNQELTIKQEMTYLGMIIEKHTLFKQHMKKAADKANKALTTLGRIMPNLGGPKELRRKLLASVVNSILLYGAPSWAHILDYVPANVEQINRVQRRALIRCICGYRTISATAINILSSTPPADLLAREREAVFLRRRSPDGNSGPNMDRALTMTKWTKRIEDSTTGQWTKTLVTDVHAWCNRSHGQMSFHLTQLMSGHGCFGTYLSKIGKEASTKCHHCGATNDDANHTFFECGAWISERQNLSRLLGSNINKHNVVKLMLDSAGNWRAVAEFAHKVMSTKEEAERTREAGRGRL